MVSWQSYKNPISSADRRAFPRFPGSAIPGLVAVTGRSALNLLDISDGGALIETPTYSKPGERESFFLQGDSSVRVAGHVLRAEVTRLKPCVHYRSAIQFLEPVPVRALIANGNYRPTAGSVPLQLNVEHRPIDAHAHAELSKRFNALVRRIPCVHAIRISSLTAAMGNDSVNFTIPNSFYGQRRVLQIFCAPDRSLTSEQFAQLKMLAVTASGLPDVEIRLR